jgi:hypothetical protein
VLPLHANRYRRTGLKDGACRIGASNSERCLAARARSGNRLRLAAHTRASFDVFVLTASRATHCRAADDESRFTYERDMRAEEGHPNRIRRRRQGFTWARIGSPPSRRLRHTRMIACRNRSHPGSPAADRRRCDCRLRARRLHSADRRRLPEYRAVAHLWRASGHRHAPPRCAIPSARHQLLDHVRPLAGG